MPKAHLLKLLYYEIFNRFVYGVYYFLGNVNKEEERIAYNGHTNYIWELIDEFKQYFKQYNIGKSKFNCREIGDEMNNLELEEKMDEEEVALYLGYKTSEKGRKAGYKQIKNLKAKFKKIAIKIIDKKDIFYQ